MRSRKSRPGKLDSVTSNTTATSETEGESNLLPPVPTNGSGLIYNSEDIQVTKNGSIIINGSKFNLDLEDLELGPILGRGASSLIRQARDKSSGLVLALKMINMFDDSKKPQLIEEIKSLYKTDCPCIVKFYGASYKEGTISLGIEFMDGGSLYNVMEQVGAVPENVLACIAFQILWGLAYLKHERRIHRDIKPQNILINSLGEVKLTDFGVSKELISSVAMGKTFVGSFRYMAPERLQNLPHTFASDIWAFGIVLQELATGQEAFKLNEGDGGKANNYIELVQTLAEAPMNTSSLPQLSPFNTSYSPEFRAFIAHCLNKDPSQRPSPETMLILPFLVMHGATSLEASITKVKAWVESFRSN